MSLNLISYVSALPCIFRLSRHFSMKYAKLLNRQLVVVGGINLNAHPYEDNYFWAIVHHKVAVDASIGAPLYFCGGQTNNEVHAPAKDLFEQRANACFSLPFTKLSQLSKL